MSKSYKHSQLKPVYDKYVEVVRMEGGQPLPYEQWVHTYVPDELKPEAAQQPPIVNVQIDGETGEIIDEFADLRSQLEEAGIRDINSIKAINGSGVVRITTRANHAAVLPGMLQAVELKAAKIGERYFDLPVSV